MEFLPPGVKLNVEKEDDELVDDVGIDSASWVQESLREMWQQETFTDCIIQVSFCLCIVYLSLHNLYL